MSHHSSKTAAPKEQVEKALLPARRGQEQKSVELFEKLLSEYPEDVLVLGNLGFLYQRTGQVDKAAECYRKLVEANPEDRQARVLLGNCYLALGRMKEARQAYLSLEGTPEFDSVEIQRRLAQTEFLAYRMFRRAGPTARLFFKRLADPAFLPSLAGEFLSLPQSLPGIRISGLRSYLAYLSQHYLQQADYRHPIRPCDFCGSHRRKATFFYRNQKNVRCRDCGLEFVERKPEEGLDMLTGFYEEDYGIEVMEKVWHDEEMLAARIERLSDLFQKAGVEFPAGGGRVLEIASGEGHLLRALADRGMVVKGIEPSGRLTRYCNEVQKAPVEQATVAGMEFEECSFDFILAYHVLEHLDRPSLLFKKAARFLAEGGYLFIEVPAPDLFKASYEQKMDEGAGYGTVGHMHYFTMETLPRYFEKYGFEVAATFQYLEESFPNGGVLGRKKI